MNPDCPSEEPSISASRECSISIIWIGGPIASAFAPVAKASTTIIGCEDANMPFIRSRAVIVTSRMAIAWIGAKRSASRPPATTPTVMPTPTTVMIIGIWPGAKRDRSVSSGAI